MAQPETTDRVSFASPYYDKLDADVSQRLALPPGLLPAIRTRGERSNADEVSSANAKTVYQIIPETRDAALKKWGIDAYLNEENAATVAGRLLKESLERNGNRAPLAVAEYVGGTDPSKWGPTTRAYVQRVTGERIAGGTDPKQSTYDRLVAKETAAATPSIARVYDAYKAGKMAPEDAAAFEADVHAGRVMLPRGAEIAPPAKTAAPTATASGTPIAPQGVIDAYQSGKMTPAETHEFETDVAEKRVSVPQGVTVAKPAGWVSRASDAINETISGAARETEQTRALPDWLGMPELSQLSTSSAKAALGTLFAGPAEAVKVIQAQYPDTKVTKDEKGNFILTSSVDGQQYAIKPGFTWGDVPRAIGAIAAFTPAGRASTVAGGAAAAGATETAIQASQAATGGDFSGKDVALAAAGGAAVPAVARVVEAAKPAVARAVDAVESRLPMATEEARQRAAFAERNAPTVAPNVAPAAPVGTPEAPPINVPPGGFKATPEAPPAAAAVPPVPPAAVVPPVTPAPAMTAEELAATARKASGGGFGSGKATETLAGQTAPDAATVKAMDELGFHYQPDHVTTNQAYRELAQAVKSVPGSETRATELQMLGHNAQKADEIITSLGGSRDLSAVNAGVKEKLGQIYKDLKTGAKEIYDEIAKRIPAATPAPAPDVLALVRGRAEQLGGIEHLTAGEKNILKALAPSEKGTEPTYALLDQTRKDIGAAKRGANETFGTRDTKILGDLEAALRKDQGRVAESLGAGQLWEAANTATKAYKGIQDDLVDLFGKSLEGSIVGNLNNAMTALPKGDVSRFVKMISAIPESMRKDVVASGLSSAFGVNARNGSINFNSYAKWFEGLERNKIARDALFANLPPEAVKSLTNLYKASKGISLATRERITTGRIQAVSEEILKGDSLLGRVFDAAKKSGAAEAVTSSIGLPGAGVAAGIASALTKGKTSAMKAADALINSPEFIAAARNASRANINRLARSGKFVAFVKAAGSPREMKDREKWISQALQANRESKK